MWVAYVVCLNKIFTKGQPIQARLVDDLLDLFAVQSGEDISCLASPLPLTPVSGTAPDGFVWSLACHLLRQQQVWIALLPPPAPSQ
jgi:hypothetical protein